MKTIRLPYPHTGQQIVRQQAKRFNFLSGGRRWRKTTLVMSIAVENAIKNRRIIWGAPTYQQVRIGFNETYKAAGGIAEFNQSRMEVVFPTGGSILYRSLDDPDNARGETADGVVIDEVADVKPAAWYEVLRPMLIDTGGWLWAIGTPKGRNWFFQEHTGAFNRDDSMAWQAPTVGAVIVDGRLVRKPHPLENPHIPFDEIVSLHQTMTERAFRQEVMSEFLEGEGSVFRNIYACMNAPISTPEQHRGHRIVAGCDWGKQNDYTAISFGCATCRQEVDRDRFNKIDYMFQAQRLRAMCDKWKPASILAERNSIGEPVIEQLVRMGLPMARGADEQFGFLTTATTKPPLIENLSLALEKTEWQFQADPVWTAELEAYEREVSTSTGRSTYGAPDNGHDDTVMARSLMVWQATNALPASPLLQAKVKGWNRK